MEVLAMGPSQHCYNDPTHSGQAPNMFLTNVGRQQVQDQRQSPFAVVSGHFSGHGPGTLSSHSTEFSDEPVDSPNMSNISWEDSTATWWEEHARMLEQQGHGSRGMQMPINNMRYTSAPGNVGFPTSEHGLIPASRPLPSSSSMDIILPASVNSGSEMISADTFISPLTPASFVPDAHALQSQTRTQHTQHRHIHSTPSPIRAPNPSELSRRTSAPARPKSSSAPSNKVGKSSPKPSAGQPPANSRSAHSAIERKYRENINSKIGELHKVLCSASPPYYPEQDNEPGGYPYARNQRPDDDDDADSASVSGQTTLPAKKADVLAGAVAYVKRSEREKRMMSEQLRIATLRLQQYDQAMAQARSRGMGV